MNYRRIPLAPRSAALVISVALVGCTQAPVVWKADGDPQQFKRDNYQCVQESRTQWSATGLPMIIAAEQNAKAESRRLYVMCMEARGYVHTMPGEPYVGLSARAIAGGLSIVSFVVGGPAANSGLRVGDVINEVDGRAVATANEFRETIDAKAPGDTVTIAVVRDGATQRIPVTIGRRPVRPYTEVVPHPW
jgi:C-terminal processing protease CtpA/Prc